MKLREAVVERYEQIKFCTTPSGTDRLLQDVTLIPAFFIDDQGYILEDAELSRNKPSSKLMKYHLILKDILQLNDNDELRKYRRTVGDFSKYPSNMVIYQLLSDIKRAEPKYKPTLLALLVSCRDRVVLPSDDYYLLTRCYSQHVAGSFITFGTPSEVMRVDFGNRFDWFTRTTEHVCQFGEFLPTEELLTKLHFVAYFTLLELVVCASEYDEYKQTIASLAVWMDKKLDNRVLRMM